MRQLWLSAKDSLGFAGVCLLSFALIFALAEVLERLVIRGKRKAYGARYAAFIGMFAALGGVLMLFELPLFFAPGFYKIDFSELPVLLCGFYLGPVAGVVTELLKVVIKLLLKGSTTAFVGDYANFMVGCCFVLPAAALYHARRTKRGAVMGIVLGTVCMCAVGSLFNAFYLIPQFSRLFGMPVDAIIAMGTAVNPRITGIGSLIIWAVVPFNLIKGLCDSLLTFLLYKRLERIFFRHSS